MIAMSHHTYAFICNINRIGARRALELLAVISYLMLKLGTGIQIFPIDIFGISLLLLRNGKPNVGNLLGMFMVLVAIVNLHLILLHFIDAYATLIGPMILVVAFYISISFFSKVDAISMSVFLIHHVWNHFKPEALYCMAIFYFLAAYYSFKCQSEKNQRSSLISIYSTLLENIVEGVAVLNESNVYYYNTQMSRILNFNSNMTVQSFQNILNTHTPSLWSKIVSLLRQKNCLFPPESHSIQIADNYYNLCICPFKPNTEYVQISLYKCRNMEAYIKEKENSSSKDIMIASCSHEIRNFLHVLSAFLELASNNDAAGNYKDHIKNAIYAKDNLSYIIHDLLDYSLIKKGLMELSITSVNLNELVGGISAMFTEQCKMKGVQFILKIDQDLPCCINSDRVRLSQIIINLLSNSIKFTVKGYISLEILPSKFNSIKIVVSDTGIGIKKECKDKLFNAFTKIKQEDTTMNPYGIGLGLMISQKLALLLGSGIVINSDELAGSSFIATINTGLTLREYQDALKIKDLSEFESTIECSNNEKSYLRLPIQKTSLSLMSECTTGVSSKMVVPHTETCKCKGVIAVDDNQFNLLALKGMLENKITLETFTDPYQSISYFKACVSCPTCNGSTLKAVLLDINMPIMNGTKCMQLMKAEVKTPTRCPKMFALSGESFQLYQNKSLINSFGFTGIITKPVNQSTLLQHIIGRYERRSTLFSIK